MSKPYTQPGEKGTDTNQASEDSLRYVLRHTKVTAYAAGKPYVVNLATVIQKEDIDAIQALIRTEKLKLLAEVRERVVGESEFPTEREEWHGEEDAKIIGRDELRDEQLIELAKLEAEL